MKIAVSGSRGTVGKLVVKAATDAGHTVVSINRTDDDTFKDNDKVEARTANAAESYEDTLKAFKGVDAVIHLGSVPNPVDKDDSYVHNNNVNSSYNSFRAAAENGVKRYCFASSVNAIGLLYSRAKVVFDYFPIDEKAPPRPSDSYALAKHESETQADSFCRIYDGMRIASMRIHEVAPRSDCKKEHDEDPENGVRQLWAWVNPEATARACLQAVTEGDFTGHEIFNIVAPDTTQDTPTEELIRKHFPNVPIKGDLSGNKSFFTSKKAEEMLGWKHSETE